MPRKARRFNRLRFRPAPDGRLDPNRIEYRDERGATHEASLAMLLIDEAWGRGCSFEAEADGYGVGAGTHGDWSGIRDSSDEAKALMLEKALNFLFPRGAS